MNIFVILIMGIMFGTYQYFTTQRSSDSVLNKDELRLQAELSCMKQYHDFASTQIELVNPPMEDDGTTQTLELSLKGETSSTEDDEAESNDPSKVSYACTGHENVAVYKYCINDAGAKIPCNDQNVKEHCVSTTKYKIFEQQETYLTSQIFKSGISIAKEKSDGEKQVEGKHVVFLGMSPEKTNPTDTISPIALITCIDSEEIAKKNKALSAKCPEGKFPVIDSFGNYEVDIDGNPMCSELPTLSSCTAHEVKSEKPTGQKECIKVGQTYCCPNEELNLKCTGSTKKVWKSSLRFFVCDEGTNYCSDKAGVMFVEDDKDTPIRTLTINDAFTSEYIEATSTFLCNPKTEKFIDECKSQTTKDYGYIGVENFKKGINHTQTSDPSNTPICRLSAKENSNAVQNCSVCEEAEYDPINERWKCSSKSWSEIRDMSGRASYIESLGAGGYNEKGLAGCFAGCTSEQIQSIKNGVRNGPDWGLTWNSSSKTWSCFQCDYDKTYNDTCDLCGKGDEGKALCVCSGPDKDKQGKCMPHECSTAYQVLIDGECYTRWCNEKILPSSGNIEINLPKENTCPNTAPWMLYNQEKTCVYCVRTPPDRLDE